MKKAKKLISLLLALTMLLSIIPMAMAAETTVNLGRTKLDDAILEKGTPSSFSHLRDMKDGYGILPLPKLDESQAGYYTLPHNAFSMMVVPSDSQKFDEACAALEALAEESYRSVTPTYYEVALGKKYFHDDESAQMFDLIMKGIKLNFGSVYQTTQIGTIGWLIRDLSQEFNSTYAANKSKYESEMQKLLDGLKALSE